MRILAVVIAVVVVLLTSGCPRRDTSGAGQQGAGAAGAGAAPETGRPIALVFSATPGDPWAREIVQTVAGDLGFAAWSEPGDYEGIDTYGPYDVELDGEAVRLHIAFSGLAAVATLEEQQALGQRCKDWIEGIGPGVVWLDGDIAQFQIGKLLELDIPVVFTGVVLDSNLFYTEHRPFTGLYKRHGISAVLAKVWAASPDARHYALISDDSPMSAAAVRRFVDIQSLLGEGHYFTVQPTVHSWSELRHVFESLGDVDAAIVCGMGGQGCSPELLDDDCPADILAGVDVPVVTLGPTRMDNAGALTVLIKPAAHARRALELVGEILGGGDAMNMPVETPDDMSQFQAVSE